MVVGDFAIELDTVVIGAGPGGYVAAIRAAQLGQKVAVVEKAAIGGVCLNVGCIPSKALIAAGHRYLEAKNSSVYGIETENVSIDFEKTQEWKEQKVVNRLTSGVEMLLKKNKVEVLKGEAYFVDEHTLRVMTDISAQTYTFNNAIVATGSRPIEIKGFPFGGRILDSTGGLALKKIPDSLVIIGGGYIGSELAGVYANLGTKVTILEGLPTILNGFEKDMVQLVERNFKKKGVKVITGALAKKAEETEEGVSVTFTSNDKEETIEAEYVLVTVGRRPNTDELGLEAIGVEMDDKGLIKVDHQGHTSVQNIYAIGDVVPGFALAHKASYEGKVAAAAISGQKVAVDYQAIPAVAFTDPEIATVGLTQSEAEEEGLKVSSVKFPLAGNGRALSLDQTEGFVRLVTTTEEQIIVGAQIAGLNASDLIAELGLAVEGGLTAEDVALTIHNHPSLGEAVMDAAEAALGMPIHM